LTNEGAGQPATGNATDVAGNTSSASATVNIDKTPPTITASATPAPNAAGWNNTSVDVAFSCSDALSGVATCPAATIVGTEGANQTIPGTTTDKAGNTASSSLLLSIDKTPPAIMATASPGANSAGWNKSDVTVSFACSDSGSGVATCPSAQVVSSEGANQVISGTATDVARNSASATATINLDKTPPVINIASPANNSVSSSSTLSVSGTATDALSGIANATCNGTAAVFQSGSFTCSISLGPGANTITVVATDVAGNTSSQSVTVSLGPAITDFNPKSASVGSLISISGSGFTAGSGVPPQVALNNQSGGSIAAPVASFSATSISFVVPDGAASGPLSITVGAQTVTSAAPINIIASTSFSLTVGPSSANLVQGQSVNFAVTLNGADGFNQLAALSVNGVPSGVSSQFSPPQITAGQTSLLTLSAPVGQAVGSATLKISASATVSGIALTQSSTASLNVQAIATSFMGRASVDDALQTPLAGVTVTFLGKDGMGGTTTCSGQTQSDEAGNFAFTGLPDSCSGEQLVGYDGSNATTARDRKVGTPVKYAGVDLLYNIVTHQVTTPANVVRLPRIDNKETAMVQQNSSQDQTFTFKTIPNLSVTVYAGTIFTLADGSHPDPFPLIAVDVPVDRLPDEMPPSGSTVTPFIVAFQPANAVASQPVAVNFPNTLNTPPGTNMELDTLNPTIGMMVKYGTGTVSSDGTQIVSDFDPAHPNHRFGLVHFDWHGPITPIPPDIHPCPDCNSASAGSNPVDLSSGLEVLTHTDIAIRGPRGEISIARTYRTLSNNAGPFGIGTNHNYGYQLGVFPFLQGQGLINLVTPDGNQFSFSRQSDGTFIETSTPRLLGAVLTVPSSGVYNLRWKDGTVYQFQPSPQGPRLAFLTSITDSNGNAISLNLNPSVPGQVIQITDPVGRSLNLTYDSSNRITSIIDPISRSVQYTYNSQGALATVTDPLGGVTSYAYDPKNRLTQITDARGVVAEKFAYDSNGRVIQTTEADGAVFSFSYTLLNPVISMGVSGPAGDGDGLGPEIQGDVFPNTGPVVLNSVTDPRGNQTTYRFNVSGLLTDVIDPSGQIRTSVRDPQSNSAIQAITGGGSCGACSDPRNGDQSVTRDASGNVLTRTDALGNTSTLTYDPIFNKVSSITDPLGNATKLTYDAHGNLLTQTDANGHTTSFAYSSFGQVTEITDPLGQKSTLAYDSFGNLISRTDPLGNTTSIVYDAISRPVQAIDALGRRSQTVYDALGRVTKQINAQDNSAQFFYDPIGNLLSVIDANGHSTSFTYDSMSRLLTKTDVLGKTDTRSYDASGNLIQFVDRRGQTSKFVYDNLNRLVEADYQDSTVTTSYDALGRLLHVNDSAGGEVDFSYDAAGRLLSSTNLVGTVQYTYDASARTSSRQLVGQAALQYSYDPVGNLLSAMLPQASATFTYDARNQLIKIARANGVTSQYQYDAAGQLLSLLDSSPATILNSQTYTYDAVGSRISYATNIAQPLTTVSVSSQYDAGNRLLQSDSTSYSYDGNGNLSSASANSGTTTFGWDGRNRLLSILGPDTHATFQYDFVGNLISQSINGASRTYITDDLTNIAALSDNGDLKQTLSGRLLDQHLAIVHSTGKVEYGLTDAIRSTVAIVDQAGQELSSFVYEPYGKTTTVSAYPFQFGGRVPTTGDLYYFRARHYSASLGRFIGEDPIAGFRSSYAYSDNSPVVVTDPSGLFGFGSQLSATGSFGFVGGAAGTISANYGAFWGGKEGINSGGFVTAGGFVGGPGVGINAVGSNDQNVAVGGGVSGSPGIFITNATSRDALVGPFQTVNVDLGPVSVQIGVSGDIVIGSLSIGVGAGFGVSVYNTDTRTWKKRGDLCSF
jgi:RHS repeat-associated protein